LTGSRFCASRWPVRCLPRGAYEFCRWISMPDGRWYLQWREVINLSTAWRHYVSRRAVLYMRRRQQLSALLDICSQLQLVSSVFDHGAVWFRTTCISKWHLCEIRIYWKVSAKIST
jgi:hypothetical protein